MKTPHTDREITNREENPLLHDTWKLLNKYRDVRSICLKSISYRISAS